MFGLKKLPGWDDFRTFGWVEYVKNPGIVLGRVEELLTV